MSHIDKIGRTWPNNHKRVEASMNLLRTGVYLTTAVMTLALCGTVAAMPFQPVIDEFWVVKNSAETFRDSFNDGILPPSGPQDGLGGNPDTYSVGGEDGMTSETVGSPAAGKLTMTPSLGSQTLISGVAADTFTGAIKLRSPNAGNVNSLEFSDSFEIHGVFDLTNLPQTTGQGFGIRASDRALGLGNEGNDVIQLLLGVNSVTGQLGVALHDLDFAADTLERVDFLSLEALIGAGGAEQIELVISKDGGTAEIGASFTVYGAGGWLGGNVLLTQSMDTFSTDQNANLAIYDGEDYTRAQFFSVDRVPVAEPATLALLGFGLAGLGLTRRRRTG